MSGGFKYIDDELQNLKQLLSFRLDNVLPQEPSSCDDQSAPKVKGSQSKTTDESKPPFHYADLIEFALRDKSQLTVSEIYDWILQRFPYFKQVDENRWKPAVRHTLTTNPGFYKAKKANRGFLWGYRSPSQRRMVAAQQRSHALARGNTDTRMDTRTDANTAPPASTKHYNWKKRFCAMEADANNNARSSSSTTTGSGPGQSKVSKPDSSQPRDGTHRDSVKPGDGVTPQDTITPGCSSVANERVLPIVPTLAHCNKTLDMDVDSDGEEASGQCTCKVEYFIPRLPSDINLASNSATCIPCCKGRGGVECCDCRPPGESASSDWSRVWEQIHGPRAPGSTTARRSSSNIQQNWHRNTGSDPGITQNHSGRPTGGPLSSGRPTSGPLSHRCLVLTHGPTVQESRSGHLLCVPVAIPIYRKTAILNNSHDTASLHQVSSSLAVAESGLLDEMPNMTRVRSVPSSHSLPHSHSHSKLFPMDSSSPQ